MYRVKLFLRYDGAGYHRGELTATVEGYEAACAKLREMAQGLSHGWYMASGKVEPIPAEMAQALLRVVG